MRRIFQRNKKNKTLLLPAKRLLLSKSRKKEHESKLPSRVPSISSSSIPNNLTEKSPSKTNECFIDDNEELKIICLKAIKAIEYFKTLSSNINDHIEVGKHVLLRYFNTQTKIWETPTDTAQLAAMSIVYFTNAGMNEMETIDLTINLLFHNDTLLDDSTIDDTTDSDMTLSFLSDEDVIERGMLGLINGDCKNYFSSAANTNYIINSMSNFIKKSSQLISHKINEQNTLFAYEKQIPFSSYQTFSWEDDDNDDDDDEKSLLKHNKSYLPTFHTKETRVSKEIAEDAKDEDFGHYNCLSWTNTSSKDEADENGERSLLNGSPTSLLSQLKKNSLPEYIRSADYTRRYFTSAPSHLKHVIRNKMNKEAHSENRYSSNSRYFQLSQSHQEEKEEVREETEQTDFIKILNEDEGRNENFVRHDLNNTIKYQEDNEKILHETQSFDNCSYYSSTSQIITTTNTTTTTTAITTTTTMQNKMLSDNNAIEVIYPTENSINLETNQSQQQQQQQQQLLICIDNSSNGQGGGMVEENLSLDVLLLNQDTYLVMPSSSTSSSILHSVSYDTCMEENHEELS